MYNCISTPGWLIFYYYIFSWEPALWHLNQQDRVMWRSKKSIAIFGNKQWLLSIDMKTKVVQHVESEWMREWKSERVKELESERMRECERVIWFPAFVWHSDIFYKNQHKTIYFSLALAYGLASSYVNVRDTGAKNAFWPLFKNRNQTKIGSRIIFLPVADMNHRQN